MYLGKKLKYCFCIFYNFRRGLSRQERIAELKSLFGDKAASNSIVKNWFNECNRGRSSLKDELRENPSKTAVVPENMRELIMQNRHVTCWHSWTLLRDR